MSARHPPDDGDAAALLDADHVHFYDVDFTDEGAVEQMFNSVVDDHGRLDALCTLIGAYTRRRLAGVPSLRQLLGGRRVRTLHLPQFPSHRSRGVERRSSLVGIRSMSLSRRVPGRTGRSGPANQRGNRTVTLLVIRRADT